MNYGYDNLYRLTSETIASDPHALNGAVNYIYDAVGNRKQITSTLAPVPAGLWNYDANDRFTAGDTYDNNGNTASSGGIANVYDFENHLIQKAGVTIVYDGDGNRVSKTVAGVTTTYLVDTLNPTGYAQVLAESFAGASGAQELSHNYMYGLELISQARHYFTGTQSLTQTIYYVYDGHGSVRALTGPTGAVTDTYDYDAFGNLLHSTGTTPNNYLFAGEQYDPALSLYYNRARYLNTATGRFWGMDTFEGDQFAPSSLHRYLYASADPVDRIDPSGQDDIASLSVSEGISEDLDATEAEADFTAKRALNLKVVDIYSSSKLQAYIIPIHCWVYANQPGNEGLRYDIGAVESERGPGLILGSVSGTLEIRATNLATVKADANLSFTKQASLSELGFIEWSAAIVSEFEFLGVLESIPTYSTNYSFNTLTNDAVNCVTFTGFAVAVAKRLAASEQ